jgi:hypothetical protein
MTVAAISTPTQIAAAWRGLIFKRVADFIAAHTQ